MIKIMHAVAGGGKTTFIVRKIIEDIEEFGDGNYLVISFQKADRLNFVRRLEKQADAVVVKGGVFRGITHAEVYVKGKKGQVHITNLHALAYHFIRQEFKQATVLVLDEDKHFWRDYLCYERDWDAEINHEFPEGLGDIMLTLYNFSINLFGQIVDLSLIRSKDEGYALLEGFRVVVGKKIDQSMFQTFLEDLESARLEYRRTLQEAEKKQVIALFYSEMLPYLSRLSGISYNAIFVDEAQDLPAFAFQFIAEWAKHCDVYVVGDINQRIFTWAGTSENFVDTLEKIAGEKGIPISRVDLKTTHRLPAWTEGFIEDFRREKVNMRYRKPESVGRYGSDVYYDSLLILVRNRAFYRNFGKIYTDFGRKFVVLNVDEVEKLERARRAFRKIQSGQAENHDYKVVQEYLGTKNIRGTSTYESSEDPLKLKLLKGECDYALISTIHRAKGREAGNVVIYNKATKNTLLFSKMFPQLEKPVMYVALTRHSETFKILTPDKQKAWLS